ncbi:MAG TPA: Crp/Fnr family transcriptional regulator [Actinomycetota bacterium]|jgi:CRP-like cAMP-binding protein
MPVAQTALRAVEEAMRGTPILGAVPPEAVGDLSAAGNVREYRRGTYLFHQGDESRDVFFLLLGRVEVSSLSVTGHRQLHTALEPPQFLGELGVLGELPRTATAVVLEDSTLWVAPGAVFLDFLRGHFEASRELLRALAAQIQAHESFVEDLLHLDLKGRVAKRLLQLVSPSLDDIPPDGSVVPAVVTHADLASLCGGSRENVTRILSEFQRRGLIERRDRRYVLQNVQGLRRIGGL